MVMIFKWNIKSKWLNGYGTTYWNGLQIYWYDDNKFGNTLINDSIWYVKNYYNWLNENYVA